MTIDGSEGRFAYQAIVGGAIPPEEYERVSAPVLYRDTERARQM